MFEDMYFYYLGHLFSNITPLCYQYFYTDGAILCIYGYYYYSSTRRLYATVYVPK